MASVNFHLEAFVPDLVEYEKVGLFTPLEIKNIVKKLTRFEYSIAKKVPCKLDHLSYIQYCINLNSLRAKRRMKLSISSHLKSDESLISRIHFLFKKTLQRFKGDVSIWLQYLDFCKKVGSLNVLSVWFAKAIQAFPTQSLFWIMAASWEFERNANITSARVLMQRALRLNAEDEKLWLEYCKLEIMYLLKLVDRQQILFKESKPLVEVPTLEGETENVVENVLMNVKSDKSALATQAIPRAVYRNAIKAIPNNVEFRIKFLSLFKEMGIAGGQASEDVRASLSADFPQDPKVVSWLLSDPLLNANQEEPSYPDVLKNCVEGYVQAIQAQSSVELLLEAVNVLGSLELKNENLVAYIQAVVPRLFILGDSLGMASREFFSAWIRVDSSIVDKAVSLHPQVSLFWIQKLNQVGDSQVYKQALKSLEKEDRACVWLHYLEWSTSHSSVEETRSLFNECLSLFEMGGTQAEESILKLYMTWALSVSATEFQTTLESLLIQRLRPVGFYPFVIQLASTMDYKLGGLYATWTERDPQNVSAWVARIQYHNAQLDPKSAGHVHWLASKTLDDPALLDSVISIDSNEE